MDNNYQEALKELKDFVHSELDGTRMLNKYIGYIETIKEFVDEAYSNCFPVYVNGTCFYHNQNILALEEVKKMWEETGWKWKERDDYHNGKDYRLYFVTKNEYSVYQPRIFFRKYDNTYYAFEGYDTTDFEGYPITEIRVLHITLDLHNLITKTLKALEKEEKHVCS